jgi:hypothetical protein
MKWLMVGFLLLATSVKAQDDYTTYYEASGFKETPRYDETVEYCKELAKASRRLMYTTFGKTPQGRDLPLLVADKDGQFTPDEIRRQDKVVLLVQAAIHSGESDGKDAGLMLLRDIAVTGKYPDLLDHVTILFIPILNVDGHERFGAFNRINQNGPKEMGWRVTAQNLNLNRDYLKADAPEMQAWIRMFNAWQPDFFVDCHVTDGSDYQYVITYIMDVFGNMVPPLTDWAEDVFLTKTKKAMVETGFEMFPYAMLLDWPNPKGGMRSWVSTPRFATGYTSLRNCPGLLIETHMLKDYKTRVSATYEMLRQTTITLNDEHESLRRAVSEADRYTASAELRNTLFPLRFAPDEERPTTIEFKGIDFEVSESDLTGGMWYRFNGKPVAFKISYFDRQVPTVEADLPEAYIIPPEWRDVIDRLELHGVELNRLEESRTLAVDSYRFEDVSWQARPYEGRHPVSFELVEIREERTYPAGSVVVDMNQPTAQVTAHILEPAGPDSYVLWGFFNTIFEQKEYAESYVMEKLAREMLAADEGLRREFEAKKQNHPEFADNPRAILNWFFQHTPYWDNQKDVYPVGKIFDATQASALLGS